MEKNITEENGIEKNPIKKRLIKKKTGILFAAVILAAAAVLGGIKLYRVWQRDQSGILLAFDDYSPESWEEYLDLFDEYGAKVTFFVNAAQPTEFCHHALDRGHEIGFHTVDHIRLKECSEEQVYEQAIAPIEVFREKGIELTSFAYPYGNYDEGLNEMLLAHYNVVRGAYFCELNAKYKLRKGFVESMPLDNVNFETDEQFQERITEILTQVKNAKGIVVGFYSHAIGGGEWCINEDNLIFLLEKAKELGLKFYTYKDLQDN